MARVAGGLVGYAPPAPRVLFLIAKPLFPPIGGAALRNWHNIITATKFAQVTVLANAESRGHPLILSNLRNLGGVKPVNGFRGAAMLSAAGLPVRGFLRQHQRNRTLAAMISA